MLTGLAMFSSAFAKTQVSAYYYDCQDPFIQIFDKALKLIAKNYDCKAESFNASSSVLLQKDQLNKAFENESALIVNLIDPAMADEVVANAQATNSRLIFFNRKLSDSALASYDNAWYVGTSSTLAGKYQAQIVFDFLSETKQFDKNQNGYLDVIFLKGKEFDEESDQRTISFVEELVNDGIRINPLSLIIADFKTEPAYLKMKSLLAHISIHDIEVIVANNDAMALGALKALQECGYNLNGDAKSFIPIVGTDGIPKAFEAIEKKQMLGTVFTDFTALALVSLRIAKSVGGYYDETLPDSIWFSYEGRKIILPFTKVAFFKNYFHTTKPYAIKKLDDNIDNVRQYYIH